MSNSSHHCMEWLLAPNIAHVVPSCHWSGPFFEAGCVKQIAAEAAIPGVGCQFKFGARIDNQHMRTCKDSVTNLTLHTSALD